MVIIQEEKLSKFPTKFEDVKKEVAHAAQDDWKRGVVDEAKKRAIYSSGSYDEFKNLVAGCTLKPIGRNEFNAPAKRDLQNRVQARDEYTSRSQNQASMVNPSPVNLGGSSKDSIADRVKGLADFEKQFRIANGALGQWQFLAQLDPAKFDAILRPEVDGELLSQIFACMHSGIEEEDTTATPEAVIRYFDSIFCFS